MKKLFTAMLLVMTTMLANAQLVINELMQSNFECTMDDLNEFPDSWVELYNTGTDEVNLGDYKLGTKDKANKAWQLPNQQVSAGGHVIIYCDKEETNGDGIHTDFRLESGDGGKLYLFKDNQIVDKLEGMAPMPAPDVAYGRETDGGTNWGYQHTPTPGKPNTGIVPSDHKILGAPVFFPKGRVVNYGQKSISVELSLPANAPNSAFITYTTDGSEPTATSTKYTKAFQLSQSTAIRAKVFCEGYLSPVSTAQSYIFHPRTMTVPIISIQTNNRYLNDRTIGIFANNKSKTEKVDWRRPINIEMFTGEDSESIFNQLGETRIQGGYSRGNDLKSMAIYANKRFDPVKKRFDYEFFHDQKPGIDRFKSFSLRDGGNDFGDLYFRDLIIQRTMGQNTDIDWQAGHTAVLYINGEYMGMLNIRERSNDDNIYSNYNGLEDIDMIEISHEEVNNQDMYVEELKAGTETNYEAFKSFYSNVADGDHSLAKWEEWMDVSEYLNIVIMNLFYGNIDFPGNNIVFWRPNDDDTKSGLPKRWRFIAKDVDFGLGLYGRKPDYNTIKLLYDQTYDSGNAWAFTEPATRLIKNMLKDPDILNLFIDKCCVFMGDFMNSEGTGAVIDDIKAEALEEFVAHRDKYNPGPSWHPNDNRTDITNKFNNAKKWLTGYRDGNKTYLPRTDYFLDFIKQQFLSDDDENDIIPIPVTINKELEADEVPNEVFVNGIKLTRGVFDGKLFRNRHITLEAKNDIENDFSVTGWKIQIGNGTPEYKEGSTYEFDVPSCTKLCINAVKVNKPEVTIGQRGAVSYSSTKALDFTGLPVEAYIVTARNGNSFNKMQVHKVPAETGLVVEGTQGTYKIPVAVGSQFDDLTGNLLQSTATETFTVPDDGNAYYGLFYSTTKNKIGFKQKLAGDTFEKGKSYLLLTQQQAKEISEIFFDTTTAIQGVHDDAWTDGKVYNLNGQRVDKSYKGVMIVNGKKVVNDRK